MNKRATWQEIETWSRQRILDANDLLDAIEEAQEDEAAAQNKK